VEAANRVRVGLPCFLGQLVKGNLRFVGIQIGWALVVKTGVGSGAVVEGLDVIENSGTRFGEGGEGVVQARI